jgi:hypothetical protein
VRKFGVDGSGNFFEAESFDEGLAVNQDRGCLGDAAGHAVLEIFFDNGGEPRIVERGDRLGRIGAVVFREGR